MTDTPKIGRPSDYSPELTAQICADLAEGYSLRTICKRDDMPSVTTVMVWLGKYEAFREQYARAREAQADAYAEDVIDIADASGFDAKIVDGRAVIDGEAVNRARLRVDARKWYAGKLAPKKYGDKVETTVQNPDGSGLMDPLAAVLAAVDGKTRSVT